MLNFRRVTIYKFVSFVLKDYSRLWICKVKKISTFHEVSIKLLPDRSVSFGNVSTTGNFIVRVPFTRLSYKLVINFYNLPRVSILPQKSPVSVTVRARGNHVVGHTQKPASLPPRIAVMGSETVPIRDHTKLVARLALPIPPSPVPHLACYSLEQRWEGIPDCHYGSDEASR